MRNIVGGVVQLKVPVTMDFKVGKSWGELKGYEL
jgi:DNA polymerase I-like protein with 3'-5' exonuclease and polymerase domains